MSKKDVIKPGHFKLAGKDRPGHDPGVTTIIKETYAEEKAAESRAGAKPAPGAEKKKRRVKGGK